MKNSILILLFALPVLLYSQVDELDLNIIGDQSMANVNRANEILANREREKQQQQLNNSTYQAPSNSQQYLEENKQAIQKLAEIGAYEPLSDELNQHKAGYLEETVKGMSDERPSFVEYDKKIDEVYDYNNENGTYTPKPQYTDNNSVKKDITKNDVFGIIGICCAFALIFGLIIKSSK